MDETRNHAKLNRPPLHRMICQLRFPQLLSLGDQTLLSIQKALAENYPNASRAQVVTKVEIGPTGTMSTESANLYRFEAEDGTAINLTDQTVALETASYKRFHNFTRRWEEIAQILSETLGIRRQNRLGLRYTNIIKRQGVSAIEDWMGLISPHLLATEASINKAFDTTASLSHHQVQFRSPNGMVHFRYGSSKDLPDDPGLPEGYLIDIDLFDDEPKVIDWDRQKATLAAWNHFTYKLLRMSVTDATWTSFQPEGS